MPEQELTVEEVLEQKKWDKIVQEFPDHSILQSWAWGEFRSALGEKTFRFAYYSGKNLAGAAQAHLETSKVSRRLYSGYGPLTDWTQPHHKKILEHLKNFAEANSCDYLVIDPQLEDTSENKKKLQSQNLKEAVTYRQLNHKWLLDLTPSIEELEKNLRTNTKRNIKKAIKADVKIEKVKDPKDAIFFGKILNETTKRNKFFAHKPAYYEKAFEIMHPLNSLDLYKASYKGQPLSGYFISNFGKHSAYLWGATTFTKEKIQSAHLAMWTAIQDSKISRSRVFDFWGIAPPGSTNHPHAGFTFFKQGFGGYYVKLILPYEYPITYKYWLTRIIGKLRMTWRKFFSR